MKRVKKWLLDKFREFRDFDDEDIYIDFTDPEDW